jgi:glycosyltransferase involved in cell wall biosynthesis
MTLAKRSAANRMKILVLHSQLGVLQGGGETFTKNLFAAFAARGHNVSAAFVADRCGRWLFPLPTCIEPIPIAGWWSSDLGQATLSSISRYLPGESQFKKLWDRIQSGITWRIFRWHNRRFQRRVERDLAGRWNDFDAIYVQSNVRLAGEIAGQHPTVLMLPGPVSADLLPILRTIPAVCAHDDGFVQMQAILGDKVLELPLGLDTSIFLPGPTSIRSNLGWTDRQRVIGYVGRLHAIKGVDLLAAAFRQLWRNNPDARLLIVGSGEEKGAICSTLSEEVARGIVHIEPAMPQEQLPSWYRAMDLMVMPSRYETMSNAVLEAMACGIPFVASNVGGNTMLGETGAGWLFDSGSASSLGARLIELLSNGSELKARGELGLKYVVKSRNWAATAERLERIICEVLQQDKYSTRSKGVSAIGL